VFLSGRPREFSRLATPQDPGLAHNARHLLTRATSSALRSAKQQLMNELKDTRVRNSALESRIEPAMTELKIVREQLAALLGSTGSEGADFAAAIAAATDNIAAVHLERVAELERELGKANTEALKVKEELSRTLREKSFIEEEYLQMTEASEAKEADQAVQA
jgi:hypothetical protein